MRGATGASGKMYLSGCLPAIQLEECPGPGPCLQTPFLFPGTSKPRVGFSWTCHGSLGWLAPRPSLVHHKLSVVSHEVPGYLQGGRRSRPLAVICTHSSSGPGQHGGAVQTSLMVLQVNLHTVVGRLEPGHHPACPSVTGVRISGRRWA